MIIANGKFTKKAYCGNCFHVIEWDSPEAEQSISGYRVVACPECGSFSRVRKAEYIEKDVIENPQVYLNGVAYETAAAAISAAKPGDTLALAKDETINYVNLKNDMTLDLNGHKLTTNNTIYAKGNTVIENGEIIATRSTDLFYANGAGNTLTLNGVTFDSKRNGVTLSNGGTAIINDCVTSAQEATFYTGGKSTLIINGGEHTSRDNGIVMDNGSDDSKAGNKITINGGYFEGHITSAGYLAHIIYLANDDSVSIKGGAFKVENGSAIVVRAGKLYVGPNASFEATGDATGKVGDGAQPIPAGHDIVIDTKSNYPAVASLEVNAAGRDILKIEA